MSNEQEIARLRRLYRLSQIILDFEMPSFYICFSFLLIGTSEKNDGAYYTGVVIAFIGLVCFVVAQFMSGWVEQSADDLGIDITEIRR
jgi:hypothetical protein